MRVRTKGWTAEMTSRRLLLAAVPCALAIAACGSSSKPSATAASADPGLQFSRCMRAHGVTNFPDPSGHGQIQIGDSSGINPQSPAFQGAQQSCRRFSPKGGPPPPMTASQRRAALRFAECMRSHGQPNFPDPTLSAPSGASRVLMLRGMQFALGPGIDPKSPAFRQAASRCGVTLPGGVDAPRPLG